MSSIFLNDHCHLSLVGKEPKIMRTIAFATKKKKILRHCKYTNCPFNNSIDHPNQNTSPATGANSSTRGSPQGVFVTPQWSFRAFSATSWKSVSHLIVSWPTWSLTSDVRMGIIFARHQLQLWWPQIMGVSISHVIKLFWKANSSQWVRDYVVKRVRALWIANGQV